MREKSNFYKRLNLLGFNSYNEYLNSEHWKNKKLEWKKSNRPKYCVGCKDTNYILHHRSYVRLGDESLNDFIPLCGVCHNRVHEYLKNSNQHLCSPRVLRDVFNLKKSELKLLLKKLTGFKGGKFVDHGKIDILKHQDILAGNNCTTYDKVGEDKNGNWLVIRRDKKNDKPAILSEYYKINGH